MENKNKTVERMLIEYSPNLLQGRDEKWQIPVEISHGENTITVTLTEQDIEAVNGRVEKHFHEIATQLYRRFLKNVSPHSITWKKHDIRDDEGNESLHIVKMQWSNGKYQEPRFVLERILGTFAARNLQFTEDEMVFFLKPNRQNEIRLPLSRFPELKALPISERLHGTNHKHNTVIYFYKVKAKLVVRDTVVDGKGLYFHPHGMSEPEFLYGISSR